MRRCKVASPKRCNGVATAIVTVGREQVPCCYEHARMFSGYPQRPIPEPPRYFAVQRVKDTRASFSKA